MRHEPTLPIKLDSTSTGEYVPLPVGRLRASCLENPQPSLATYGPRDAAEWRRFRAIHGTSPG